MTLLKEGQQEEEEKNSCACLLPVARVLRCVTHIEPHCGKTEVHTSFKQAQSRISEADSVHENALSSSRGGHPLFILWLQGSSTPLFCCSKNELADVLFTLRAIYQKGRHRQVTDKRSCSRIRAETAVSVFNRCTTQAAC